MKELFSLKKRDLLAAAELIASIIITVLYQTLKLNTTAAAILCLAGFIICANGAFIVIFREMRRLNFFTPQLLFLLASAASFFAGEYLELLLAAELYCVHNIILSSLNCKPHYNTSGKTSLLKYVLVHYMRYYVPAIVLISAAILLIPFSAGADIEFRLRLASAFIFAAGPLAFTAAGFLSYAIGFISAGLNGYAIKSEEVIERSALINTIIFDENSIFQDTEYKVEAALPVSGLSEENLILLAAYAEYNFDHNVSRAIVRACSSDIDPASITAHESIPGFGVIVHANGVVICAGSIKMMEKLNMLENAQQIYSGTDCIHLAVNGSYAGCIVMKRTEITEINETIADIRENGISRIVLFSGSNQTNAAKTAHELGIEEYYSLPDDDTARIEFEKLISDTFSEETLGYLGNNQEFLNRADVGITAGSAEPLYDIVLSSPKQLPNLIKASRRTAKSISSCIVIALLIKLLFLILIISGVLPFFLAPLSDCGTAIIIDLLLIRTASFFKSN